MAGSSRVEQAEITTYRLRLRNMLVPPAEGQRGLSAASERRDISARDCLRHAPAARARARARPPRTTPRPAHRAAARSHRRRLGPSHRVRALVGTRHRGAPPRRRRPPPSVLPSRWTRGAAGGPASAQDLVAFVNRMNAEWVAVARRMSPRVIVDLLEVTGPWVVDLFGATDPFAPAHWSVTWAGEESSAHWFDVGRDYTERWLHQQQIRDAVGAQPLTGPRVAPSRARSVRSGAAGRVSGDAAAEGSTVRFAIDGTAGDIWTPSARAHRMAPLRRREP